MKWIPAILLLKNYKQKNIIIFLIKRLKTFKNSNFIVFFLIFSNLTI